MPGAMTTRAMSTAHAPSGVQSVGMRWVEHHLLSMRTAIRVLRGVAVIAVTLTLAVLIAVMLFAPMLP